MSSLKDIELTNVTDDVNGDIIGYYDISIAPDGDLVLEEGFDTNIIMSLFTERRADSGEVREPSLRRGWWGNLLWEDEGFENGSKLWLLEQAKLTTSNVRLSEDYSARSLDWFKTDGFLKEVEVISTPVYSASAPAIRLAITLVRNDNSVEQKYFDVWQSTGA